MGKTLTIPQLGAVVAGNALEFYDFLTFSFFAVQIGKVFFPGADDTSALLLTLATFGVGFATRPLGGLLIGPLGDRLGRKPAMLFCFGLMGFSIVGLALTPSYASIGIAAPLLVVFFRLLQGFALGGEVGPTTAFLLEAAPMHRRGLYVSLQHATQQVATLTAGVVGLALANLLSPADLTDWGWRIAMLLGAAVVPFALIIRRSLPETLHVQSGARPRLTSRPVLVLALMGVAMIAGNTIATYTMNYMGTYAVHTLGLPPRLAFAATVTTGFCCAVSCLLCGWLSDRVGRKPVMIAGTCALLAAGVPCFVMLTHTPSVAMLVAMSAVMATLLGFNGPPIIAGLTESVPPGLRAGSLGIIYAVSVASFGGTAQFMAAWLTKVSGSPLAPAWYMSGALVVSLCGMVAMRETAPVRVDVK
jgi:MHS family citrate/tricarballylate:H+ symporter-like MFS transporter